MRKKFKYMINLIRMDIQNQICNKEIMVVIAIPFLFGGLMSYLYSDVAEVDRVYGNFAFYMTCLMMVCIMGGVSLPLMIAEEKEHGTLRTLRQSGVRDCSFVFSKMSICLIVTEAGCLITALETNVSPLYLPLLFLLIAMAFLVFGFMGICISILSVTQNEVGVYSAPMVLIFMIPALLGEMSEILDRVARYTPLDAMMKAFWGITGTALHNIHTGEVWIPDPWFHTAVLFAWTVGTGILCLILYKRKSL